MKKLIALLMIAVAGVAFKPADLGYKEIGRAHV